MSVQNVEERYTARFKTIRNKMRKYDTISLLRAILYYIAQPVKHDKEEVERLPWVALLAIKWLLADEHAFRKGGIRPSDRQTHELLSDVYDMNDVTHMPDAYSTLHLFMKAMAFQQFSFQEGPRLNRVVRQFFLFDVLPNEHYLKRRFQEVTNIPTTDFILMSALLMATFAQQTPAQSHVQNLMGALQKVFPNDFRKFVLFLSTTPLEARAEILDRDLRTKAQGKLPRNPSEYYEQSFFVRHPLLFVEPHMFVVERHVLYRAIEYAMFDTLRSDNPNVFMSAFGPIFEKHIEKFIQQSGLSFFTERQIKEQLPLPKDSLLIDFILSDGNSNFFIDAKAGELHYEGKNALSFEDMNKWVSDSLSKAIKQASAVLATIAQKNSNCAIKHKDHNYLIVVTYKELYISNGPRLIECIGKQNFEALTAGLTTVIPACNMYFMNIDDFEALINSVGQGKITLSEAIDSAIAKDANPSTACYSFGQHLEQLGLSQSMTEYYQSYSNQRIEERVRRDFD